MPHIRPVSDLRNKFTEISRIVHEGREPVFLTKNGHGDMVVMSIGEYERLQFGQEVVVKLLEAERDARSTTERYSHEEVFSILRERLENEKKP